MYPYIHHKHNSVSYLYLLIWYRVTDRPEPIYIYIHIYTQCCFCFVLYTLREVYNVATHIHPNFRGGGNRKATNAGFGMVLVGYRGDVGAGAYCLVPIAYAPIAYCLLKLPDAEEQEGDE